MLKLYKEFCVEVTILNRRGKFPDAVGIWDQRLRPCMLPIRYSCLIAACQIALYRKHTQSYDWSTKWALTDLKIQMYLVLESKRIH